jgi:CRISPR-associated protein Cas1
VSAALPSRDLVPEPDAQADHDAERFSELVPAAMVRKYAYCPRLFHLEWVQREWEDTEDTVRGETIHRRVDEETGSLPDAMDLDPDDRVAARAVLLSAPRLGLIAKLDLLEGEGGRVRPVDYKKGAPGPDGPREPERVQLCAQGLVLRENGYRCDEGVLYYAETRSRHVVPFDEALVARTLELVAELRGVAADPIPPPPLVDSPKCPRCALVGICLPDETNLLRDEPLTEVRRLVPARDDAGPLYVLDQGASVGKSGERLVVRTKDGAATEVRLIDVSHLALYGNVQISAQAIRTLAEREVPVFHHTYGGWLAAITSGLPHRNVELRSWQYRLADDEAASLRFARAIVMAKIRNQRVLLRRNARDDVSRAVDELGRLAAAAGRASSADLLLGIEGLAARTYFASFGGLLRGPVDFNFESRNRRPPTDPVNALLSFLYSLLVKECLYALLAVGLDPHRGFYHRLRYGRPSLALDLAEEFRPLLADSVVLTLVNNRMVDAGDFVRRGPACALTAEGRRRVIEAFEGRIDTLVRHPVFGYSVSYRRTIELQTRLLARWIAGELRRYRPFTTR